MKKNLNLLFIFLVSIFKFPLHSAPNESQLDDLGYWRHSLFEAQANQRNNSLYEEAAKDRIKFWEKCALEIEWFKPWNKAFNWACPYSQWYIGGKLNLSYNCLDKHLPNQADKTAFIWLNERGNEKIISYGEMYEETCRLANGLKKLGVKKGDMVAIFMPMVPEGIAAMLACARIGAIHSVIFGGTGAGSTKEKINDGQAKIIITADEGYRRGSTIYFLDTVDRIINDCPSVEYVVVLKRNEQNQKQYANPRYISYKDLTRNCPAECLAEPIDSEDISFVLYTSGTTGKAKGIVHTSGGYLVGVHNTFKWVFDYKPQDIFWCTADIGWITGHSYVVYGPMSNGATQIIYEGAFDYPGKDQAWSIVEKYKVNTFYTAPTLIRTFMKWGIDDIKKHDISSLRLLGSIGEPLNPEAWQWYHDNVGSKKCPIVDTWFQTETGALVISPIPGLTPLKPGSVTMPLPGFEVAVLNDSGEAVEHGLLAITSPFPSMLRGVLNSPERYYNTYWAKWEGQYYYPGDDATKDENGYIWARGRADEVLKVAGHRVGTAEIENALVDFPGVCEAAVVGINDEIKGQKIVALIVLEEGIIASEELRRKIKESVADYMGKYAQPEIVAFIKDLPKTRSGKILRRVIVNLIEGKNTGDITTLQNGDIMVDLELICKEIRNILG